MARIIANGVTRRGSTVSSARSAAPSQPMKQYRGSSAASTRPYQSAPPDVRWVDVRIAKPASRWKKKIVPKNSRAAATTEPAISKSTPVLLTIAAPVSPGPWRDYWILTDYRSGPPPVVAEASTLDGEMHLVARGAGLSITSEAVGTWYKRPGVTFVPIVDLPPCSVTLAWWPQDTALVAGLAAVANEVRP